MGSLFHDFGWRVVRAFVVGALGVGIYSVLFVDLTPRWATSLGIADAVAAVYWPFAVVVFLWAFFIACDEIISGSDISVRISRFVGSAFDNLLRSAINSIESAVSNGWVCLLLELVARLCIYVLLPIGVAVVVIAPVFAIVFASTEGAVDTIKQGFALLPEHHHSAFFWDVGFYALWNLVVPLAIFLLPVVLVIYSDQLQEHPRIRELFIIGKGGSARWSGLRAYKKLFYFNPYRWSSTKRLFLGRSLFEDTVLPRNVGIFDDAHMLTIAQTASGKSTSAIWPNLMMYEGSALVFDPKGEHAKRTLGRRQSQRFWKENDVEGEYHPLYGTNTIGITKTSSQLRDGRCWLLDPFRVVKEYPAAPYNLLSEIDIESDNVRGLLSAISDGCVIPEGDKDAHWVESAKTVLEGIIAHVLSRHPKEEQNLPFIFDLLLGMRDSLELAPGELPEDLTPKKDEADSQQNGLLKKAMGTFKRTLDISDPNALDELLIEMRTNGAAGGLPQLAANVLDKAGDKERGSIMTTVFRAVKWISDPAMRKALQDGPMRFSSLYANSTIYLVLPERFMGEMKRWLRSIISLSVSIVQTFENKPQLPILYILDEFPLLGKLKKIEDGIVTFRGAGIKLWPIIQEIGQLKSDYKENWQAFPSSSAVQLFGVNDTDTATWATQRMGEKTLKQKKGWIFRTTVSKERIDLLTHDAIMSICGKEDNRQIVIPTTGLPMRLERMSYTPYGRFKGLPLDGKYDDF